MSEIEVDGASLPSDGIDVDETAAYFGVTKTADLIMRLNTTDRLNGLGEFLTLTSDLLLTDSFDFDVVSERLECESGEIYYLLSGPFEIFTMTDGLRLYLGQEDSEGNQGTDPGIPVEERNAIDAFNDPFRLLKMLAIGHTIGGIKELDLYLAAFSEMVNDPDTNRVRLIALHHQLDQVLNKAKETLEVVGLSVLGTTNVAMKVIEAPKDLPKTASPEPVAVVETPAPEVEEIAVRDSKVVSSPDQNPAEDALAAAFTSSPTVSEQNTSTPIPNVSGESDVLESAFAAAEPSVQSPPPVETPQESTQPSMLAPARAPVGASKTAGAPSFGSNSGNPTFGSIHSEQPTFGAPPSSVPAPRPAGTGKVRGGGFPGIRSTIQTGVYCASCGIGVEHHWRHCPVCSNRLI